MSLIASTQRPGVRSTELETAFPYRDGIRCR